MLLVVSILLLTLLYFVANYLTQQSADKLPPGPWKVPIVGSLFSVAAANTKFPHHAMHKLSKKYGPIMSLKFGVHDSVLLSSFDVIKEALTRKEFSGRYDGFPFVRERSFRQSLGLVFGNGDMWSEARRFTIRNLREVGFEKMNSVEATVQEDLEEIITLMKSISEESNGLRNIDPDMFTPCLANILWSYIAGFKFKLNDSKLQTILKHNVAVVKAFNMYNVSTLFPYLRNWFPRLTNYHECIKAHTQLQDFVREFINETRVEMKKGKERHSFMEAFIREIESNLGKTNEETIFTEQQLIMVVKDMFVAGTETTSYTLSWSIIYMILNPAVQSRVQSEIDAVLPSRSIICWSDFEKLPYTEATILEVFRIASVNPLLLPRMALEDGNLGGYLIPKGTAIFANIYPVMMDKDYWGDPTVFRPERFLNKNQTQVINKERMVMFGFGHRSCIGEGAARVSFFLYFASLLQTFTFRQSPGGRTPSTEPQANFLTMKPHPYDAIVTVRNRTNE